MHMAFISKKIINERNTQKIQRWPCWQQEQKEYNRVFKPKVLFSLELPAMVGQKL